MLGIAEKSRTPSAPAVTKPADRQKAKSPAPGLPPADPTLRSCTDRPNRTDARPRARSPTPTANALGSVTFVAARNTRPNSSADWQLHRVQSVHMVTNVAIVQSARYV